jgi:hypothetical protein
MDTMGDFCGRHCFDWVMIMTIWKTGKYSIQDTCVLLLVTFKTVFHHFIFQGKLRNVPLCRFFHEVISNFSFSNLQTKNISYGFQHTNHLSYSDVIFVFRWLWHTTGMRSGIKFLNYEMFQIKPYVLARNQLALNMYQQQVWPVIWNWSMRLCWSENTSQSGIASVEEDIFRVSSLALPFKFCCFYAMSLTHK